MKRSSKPTATGRSTPARSAPQQNQDAHISGFDPEGVELVFGFVGPTGVDLTKVCDVLKTQLKAVQYETKTVTLSELISPYAKVDSKFPNEYHRIRALMTRGTELREDTGQADIVGRLGIAKIRSTRKELGGTANSVLNRTAYIVRSFKRPEEVTLFRNIYGKAFTLISVYAPKQARINNLAKKLRGSTGETTGFSPGELAVELIERDYAEEGRPLGQQLGRTFPLADYFVTSESKVNLELQLRRLVRLTFGDPYISPTREEQAMFFAQAAALRSLDLSRQVGA